MKNFPKLGAAFASLGLLATQAHADLPAGVSTSITAAGTDGGTIIAGLAAAGAAVWLIAKVLRKFGLMM